MKDLLGVLSSGLCVAHCLLIPAAIAAGVPLAGAGEDTHLLLSFVVVALAVWAFPSGWRQHRHALPGAIALLGVSLLMLTVFTAKVLEVYLAILAAVSLITAHLMNRQLLDKTQ